MRGLIEMQERDRGGWRRFRTGPLMAGVRYRDQLDDAILRAARDLVAHRRSVTDGCRFAAVDFHPKCKRRGNRRARRAIEAHAHASVEGNVFVGEPVDREHRRRVRMVARTDQRPRDGADRRNRQLLLV